MFTLIIDGFLFGTRLSCWIQIQKNNTRVYIYDTACLLEIATSFLMKTTQRHGVSGGARNGIRGPCVHLPEESLARL